MHTHAQHYKYLFIGFSHTITFWNGKHPRGIVFYHLLSSWNQIWLSSASSRQRMCLHLVLNLWMWLSPLFLFLKEWIISILPPQLTALLCLYPTELKVLMCHYPSQRTFLVPDQIPKDPNSTWPRPREYSRRSRWRVTRHNNSIILVA